MISMLVAKKTAMKMVGPKLNDQMPGMTKTMIADHG